MKHKPAERMELFTVVTIFETRLLSKVLLQFVVTATPPIVACLIVQVVAEVFVSCR